MVPRRRRVRAPAVILEVREVGRRVAKPVGEGMADLIHRERLAGRLASGGANQLVRARRGRTGRRQRFIHERDRGEPPALSAGHGDVEDGSSRWKSAWNRRAICDGRMPVQRISSRRVRVIDPGVSSARTASMCERCTQGGLGWRRREGNEIDQVDDDGASTVQEAHEMDECMAPLVAARRGMGLIG